VESEKKGKIRLNRRQRKQRHMRRKLMGKKVIRMRGQ
jgi:hypothetical protein